MAENQYTITRENASELLGISTRTIDRYIKSGRLTYKKIANKVLLSKVEVQSLHIEFGALRQETAPSELMSGDFESQENLPAIPSASALDKKLDKFFDLLTDKDKQVEEKNRLVFMLQQRIGELESKIQHMIALPDYNQEKQNTLIEKEKLEQKIQELQIGVKTEKIKGMVYVGIILIIVIILIVAAAGK
ncbi:MAG TPA: helix-turn-helix domain-containing protein [Candidatus Absconditabacterales bacterium]|nr:helix-turn-helix domain-containing protein [Candidatus Absconditabacterales bacterium]HMT27160.1 helix-turn-helix domain-containing protein [Candidatus Absconditabacterales bacterium]